MDLQKKAHTVHTLGIWVMIFGIITVVGAFANFIIGYSGLIAAIILVLAGASAIIAGILAMGCEKNLPSAGNVFTVSIVSIVLCVITLFAGSFAGIIMLVLLIVLAVNSNGLKKGLGEHPEQLVQNGQSYNDQNPYSN